MSQIPTVDDVIALCCRLPLSAQRRAIVAQFHALPPKEQRLARQDMDALKPAKGEIWLALDEVAEAMKRDKSRVCHYAAEGSPKFGRLVTNGEEKGSLNLRISSSSVVLFLLKRGRAKAKEAKRTWNDPKPGMRQRRSDNNSEHRADPLQALETVERAIQKAEEWVAGASSALQVLKAVKVAIRKANALISPPEQDTEETDPHLRDVLSRLHKASNLSDFFDSLSPDMQMKVLHAEARRHRAEEARFERPSPAQLCLEDLQLARNRLTHHCS